MSDYYKNLSDDEIAESLVTVAGNIEVYKKSKAHCKTCEKIFGARCESYCEHYVPNMIDLKTMENCLEEILAELEVRNKDTL